MGRGRRMVPLEGVTAGGVAGSGAGAASAAVMVVALTVRFAAVYDVAVVV